MGVLNNIIQDVDNDVGRLCHCRETSRPPKKKNLVNFGRRCITLLPKHYQTLHYFIIAISGYILLREDMELGGMFLIQK